MGLAAKKTSIHDVFIGFKEEPEQKLILDGKNVTHIRVMGRVVAKFLNEDETFGSITIDDETSTIRAKFFASNITDLNKIKLGDLVEVMGRVKKYQDEVHMITDSLSIFENMNFELLRKLELISKNEGLEKKVILSIKTGLIKREELIKEFGDTAIKTIATLMDRGDIYESNPGSYSVVE
ncbi:MAG: hypothetical protein GOU98_01965 [Candidatus Altiarchaeota archaeon]|nr:hypothetical protein [Candidatus Altiarchaeota archaeon]